MTCASYSFLQPLAHMAWCTLFGVYVCRTNINLMTNCWETSYPFFRKKNELDIGHTYVYLYTLVYTYFAQTIPGLRLKINIATCLGLNICPYVCMIVMHFHLCANLYLLIPQLTQQSLQIIAIIIRSSVTDHFLISLELECLYFVRILLTLGCRSIVQLVLFAIIAFIIIILPSVVLTKLIYKNHKLLS